MTCWTTATAGTGTANQAAWLAVRNGVTLDPSGDHPLAVIWNAGTTAGRADRHRARNAGDTFLRTYLEDLAKGSGTGAGERVQRALEKWREQTRKATGGKNGPGLAAAMATEQGLQWVAAGGAPVYVVAANGRVQRATPDRDPGTDEGRCRAGKGPEPYPAGRGTLERGDTIIAGSTGLGRLTDSEIGQLTRTEGERLAGRLARTAAGTPAHPSVVVVATLRLADAPKGPKPVGTMTGRRTEHGIEVTVDGRPLDWQSSLRLMPHSPEGLGWGERGAASLQLALALLLTVTEPELALEQHERFHDQVVAALPFEQWSLPTAVMRDWSRNQPPTGMTTR